MPNLYKRSLNDSSFNYNDLSPKQQARYDRQKERAGEDHDYMKNLNLAAIPGAINNVFTGTTTIGDGYIWDAPTTGQENGWKIASNVLGLGDSLYELAHPAYSDPSVQNYINQNKGIIDTIEANVNDGIGATSTSGLMDLISNSNYASTDYDLDQLGNDNNVGKTIGGIGKAMFKGAKSGSIGGLWGALGGAATGLITGIGAAFSGAKNKKADATNLQNQLKTRAAIANNRQSAAFQLGNSNIQSNNIRNQLMNNYNANSYGFAAYGGKLYPFGGALAGYGGDWTNGLNFINNGGTHEENPYEGVPVSIAQDGQPNLVEEGEVVWNDYVFSNRLEVPKEVMEQLKLGKGKRTFAEVVEKVQKEAAERPNDPIAKRGLEDSLQKLAAAQEQVRAEQEQQDAYNQAEDTAAMYADGGPIHIAKNKRGTFTAAAAKNGMGVQEFAKHVLANKDKYSTNTVRKAVFAHNANSWEHGYGGYLADPYIQNALGGHIAANGMLFNTTDPPVRGVAKTPGGYMLSPVEVVTTKPSANSNKDKDKYNGSGNDKPKFDETWLRYAPVLGSAIGAMVSLFDKPDMEYANAIERSGREAAGKLRDVKAKPIGDYLAYNPFDRLFYANQLGAQAAAQRRAIENAASGNIGAAMAGLASAGYNADVALGQLYRQGEEYNLAQRQKVADFNRGTNMFNSQEDLRAQMINAQTAAQRASIIQNALTQAAALKLGEKNRIQEARSLNLTNFFDNLGNIGWEAVNRNMINSNRALYYYMQANGISNYKGATEDQKDEIAVMLGKSRKEADKIGAQYDRENKNS